MGKSPMAGYLLYICLVPREPPALEIPYHLASDFPESGLRAAVRLPWKPADFPLRWAKMQDHRLRGFYILGFSFDVLWGRYPAAPGLVLAPGVACDCSWVIISSKKRKLFCQFSSFSDGWGMPGRSWRNSLCHYWNDKGFFLWQDPLVEKHFCSQRDSSFWLKKNVPMESWLCDANVVPVSKPLWRTEGEKKGVGRAGRPGGCSEQMLKGLS